MNRGARRERLAWTFAAGAALVALASAWLPTAVAVGALAMTFLLTPGALAARALLREGASLPGEAATLAWSPFLSGGAVVLFAALGLPFAHAVRLVVLGIGVLAAARALRTDPTPVAWSPRADLAVSLAWMVVVACLLVGVSALPLRSDGWFHAAVTLQIAQRGIAPEDPYFAGLQLLYFWGEHAWAAAWLVLAPQLSATVPLVACNLAAAAAVALGTAALARRLGGGTRVARLAVLLMIAGYAPFAWVQVAGRAVVGEVKGWSEVVRLVGTGPDAALDLMGRGLLHASLVFFGDKFLVVTPFAIGLALLLLILLALLDVSDSPGTRRQLVLGLSLAATLFLHSVVGYCALLIAAVWWAKGAVSALRGDAAARVQWFPLARTLLLSVAVVSPYLIVTVAGKQGQLQLGLTSGAVRSALLGGAAIMPAALLWMSARSRQQAPAQLLWVGACLLLVLGLGVRLPENNQSKFFNLLWLLCAAPAALAYEEMMRRVPAFARSLVAVFGAIALLPTVALCLWTFALERGQSASAVRRSTPSEREALQWLRRHTPAHAVLCDLSGARDLLTTTGRSVAWGGPGGERDWGYAPEALAVRRASVRALCMGEVPSDASREWLESLDRPLWVVARSAAPESLSGWRRLALQPPGFEPQYANAEMAFYRWQGAR